MNIDFNERFDLSQQVAIVTGGGGGIGRAISLALASAGATVVIADIVPERCEETAARIKEMSAVALPAPTDVIDTDQIRATVALAQKTYGRIDILVNNAGGVGMRPFLDQSERSWRKHIDLNLVSMLAATSAVAPIMIAGGRGGSIINVSSIEASRAAPCAAVYSACKAGMESFTRTMALELADDNIRINAIAPDYTETPGIRGNITGPVDKSTWYHPDPVQEDANIRRIPANRVGVDTECGDAALFLASKMSSYITGTILHVDGGTWASSGWARNKKGKWSLTPEY